MKSATDTFLDYLDHIIYGAIAGMLGSIGFLVRKVFLTSEEVSLLKATLEQRDIERRVERQEDKEWRVHVENKIDTIGNNFSDRLEGVRHEILEIYKKPPK
jgi:hypothetical protein